MPIQNDEVINYLNKTTFTSHRKHAGLFKKNIKIINVAVVKIVCRFFLILTFLCSLTYRSKLCESIKLRVITLYFLRVLKCCADELHDIGHMD